MIDLECTISKFTIDICKAKIYTKVVIKGGGE